MALTIGERMALVRFKDTQPELAVRKLLTRYGVRYRLHRKDLPGRPDIYLPRLRLAIFINGCFWHGHGNCPRATLPKTNTAFWSEKIRKNVERDARNAERLRTLGINPMYLWTCKRSEFPNACLRLALRWKKKEKSSFQKLRRL